jgi:hypothetical protein
MADGVIRPRSRPITWATEGGDEQDHGAGGVGRFVSAEAHVGLAGETGSTFAASNRGAR